MASKYAHLRGVVPSEPTERDEAFAAEHGKFKGLPIKTLMTRYNETKKTVEQRTSDLKESKLTLDVIDALIRQGLKDTGADAMSAEGFTWSASYEPYPIAEDPAAIVEYFMTHGMEDQLKLKASELAARLKNHVKEESLNNELVIGTRTVPDPETGEPKEVPDVRSQIPGVRVYLDESLSRVKSGKGK